MAVEISSRTGGFTVWLINGADVIERREFLSLDGAENYAHKLKNRYGL